MFNNATEWVYTCSCNQPQTEAIDCLPTLIKTNVDDFYITECIHVKAVKTILANTDDIHPEVELAGTYNLVTFNTYYM